MADLRRVLITAFEPSGDALGAALAQSLRELDPAVEIFALGGPRLAAAGARLLETTTEHAVMLLGAAGQAWAHHQRLGRLRAFLRVQAIDALVPVDSAAANWSICKLVRRERPGAKVVHLVLPQLWAWAPWRIHKLRRLTDHVLCLLPFEPGWLAKRGVAGTFVGHPLFDPQTGARARAAGHGAADLPAGGLKLALLPGSRPGVIARHLPLMLEVHRRLLAGHPELVSVVATSSEAAQRQIEAACAALPDAAPRITRAVDPLLAWADVVLVNSGTATLHAAAHRVPMVVVYRVNRAMWTLLGRFLVRTRTFALPNVMAEMAGESRIVPELVPHFGTAQPVEAEVAALLENASERAAQRAALERIAQPFEQVRFGPAAARRLLEVMDDETAK